MLARRDYSQCELAEKLKKKILSRYTDSSSTEADLLQDIHLVLADLKKAGFINEARFTEHYIHWRRNKGYGPKRIAAELQARGIEEEMITQQLEQADHDWLAEAQRVWKKHFKGNIASDFQSRATQMRFLQYRGFKPEHIAAILKPDTDDLT